MSYVMRRVATPDSLSEDIRETLELFDITCFPSDVPYGKKGSYWWLMYDEAGKPVAFCGLKPIKGGEAAFLCRAGVLYKHRGHRLQKRMIRARERAARALGIKTVITYTSIDNIPSMNSLVGMGYRFYTPQWRWGGKESLYYKKDLW